MLAARLTAALFLVAAAAAARPAPAQRAPTTTATLARPTLSVAPARPARGAVVQVIVRGGTPRGGTPRGGTSRTPADSVTGARGTLAGEALHFERLPSGRLRALGGVPVDAADSLIVQVTVERASGRVDTLAARVPVAGPPPTPPAAARPAERLRVAAEFGREPDSALAARIAREGTMAREVGRRAHDTPKLWRGSFLRPRASRITSRFGTGREFNGAVRSSHQGIDFAGKLGEPVRATNRGVVALVGDFHLAGRVVYVDHGAGLVTAYFHLSATEVAVGDTVTRGQVIGRVGQSGRVTGPHLHWAARYGTLVVNPLTLLAIDRPPPAARKPAPRRPVRRIRGTL
ncbi:MAG: M23 family metallopeptidase [Gemmatimonadaceae bacterium]